MTLGRTSTGAIKIKTDEAGGGLRAVECACCGGCAEGKCSPQDYTGYFVQLDGFDWFFYLSNEFPPDECGATYQTDFYDTISLYRSHNALLNKCGTGIQLLAYINFDPIPCTGESGYAAGFMAGSTFVADPEQEEEINPLLGTHIIELSGDVYYGDNYCTHTFTVSVTITQ